MHHIQQYILDKLIFAEFLRNRDMRPPHVESNLYQYHLLQLKKDGYIKKQDSLYTLSKKGLKYAGSHSTTLKKPRPQPTVLVVVLVVNKAGKVLIRTKQRQPFIGMKSLFMGKMHINETAVDAAKREFCEKVRNDADGLDFEYIGTTHMVIRQKDCVVSDYIGIITKVIVENNFSYMTEAVFCDPAGHINGLSPGIRQILDMYSSRLGFIESTIEM
jgi:hypothetical protein